MHKDYPDAFFTPDTFSRNGGAEKSLMDAVNRHMRKVEKAEKVELHNVAPLAIRCALKNVSPCSHVRPMRLCIIYSQFNMIIGVFVFVKIIVFKCDRYPHVEVSVFLIVQAKGWTKEAIDEFQKMVGSSALEMRISGQDKDLLLVDLMKTPKDQSCDKPISVRQYLVFIEVARYLGKWMFRQKF